MKLYTLLFGRSKKKMRPIMIDEKHKCENYMKARKHTTEGWHKIVEAEPGATVWRKKSATVGGNKDDGGRHGWIGKNGFHPHT